MCMIDFKLTNRRHHCRLCGKSVCDKCSLNKRYLSKSDKKTYHRVCDFCDTKLSNYKVTIAHNINMLIVRIKLKYYIEGLIRLNGVV